MPPHGPEYDAHMMTIASSINRLWQASKVLPCTENWADQDELHKALRSVVKTDFDMADHQRNPLNLILPGYETMWRVVMRCLLEVSYRDAERRAEWEAAFQRFVSNPTQEQFHARKEGNQASVMDIVKEGLRLYPPARRIHRQFPSDSKDSPTKADLEKCHRNSQFEHPKKFDPSRWMEIAQTVDSSSKKIKDYEEELGFMPFGTKNFQCPAGRSGFGWKMIGMLVGVLVNSSLVNTVTDQEEWELSEESRKKMPASGEPLKSDREDYADLKLKRE